MTTIQKVIAAVLALAALVGIVYKVDGRWARVERLLLVEYRLEQKIQADRAGAIQERIWNLEKRYPSGKGAPVEVRDEMNHLRLELKELWMRMEKKEQ